MDIFINKLKIRHSITCWLQRGADDAVGARKSGKDSTGNYMVRGNMYIFRLFCYLGDSREHEIWRRIFIGIPAH